MKSTEYIIAQCIDEIKTDRATLSECLERYPDIRHELEPLLIISTNIKYQNIQPSGDFKIRAKANLMEHIQASKLQKRASVLPQPLIRQHFWHASWKKAFATATAVILMGALAGTTTTYAAKSSLPGEALYSVKLGTEQLQRMFTFSNAAEAELDLRFAEIRLDEMEKVIGKPEGTNATQAKKITIAAEGYDKNIRLAIEKSNQADNSAEILEKIALSIILHMERLGTIENTASQEMQQIVAQTKSSAINKHMDALKNLSLINPEKAREINNSAIQKRLEKAEKEASQGNSKASREAMEEVEKLRRFGSTISASPHEIDPGHENHNNKTKEKQEAPGQNHGQDSPGNDNGRGLSDVPGKENYPTGHNQQSPEPGNNGELPGPSLETAPGKSGDSAKPEESSSQSSTRITRQPGCGSEENSASFDLPDINPPRHGNKIDEKGVK